MALVNYFWQVQKNEVKALADICELLLKRGYNSDRNTRYLISNTNFPIDPTCNSGSDLMSKMIELQKKRRVE
jgi:hypothetical protein